MKIGLVAALAAAAGGCGTESGVLIEVTRDESVPAEVIGLEFHVGIDKIDGYPSSFADLAPEEMIELDDRDLAADPYRLMLRANSNPNNAIMVAVLALGEEGEVVGFGDLDEPVRFVDEAVAEWTIVLTSGLPEGYTVTETGCVKYIDENGEAITIGPPGDHDCDGYTDDVDCNDFNPAASPGAPETCGNQIDDDCDGTADEDVDEDGDQVTTCGGDCNDSLVEIFPGAVETCDGSDNDCDGLCDEEIDGDGDRYTVCGSKVLEDGSCFAFVPEAPDCDDGDQHTYPGAAESCDGADNDCDGVCDDDGALDPDGDSFTECGSILGLCGTSDFLIDCQPEIGAIYPGAAELCNGADDNCDGEGLTSQPCFVAGVDICETGLAACTDAGEGTLGDCAQLAEGHLVPDGFCGAYGECVANQPADPYTCAIDASATIDVFCKAYYLASTGEQCPVREAVLPGDPLLQCSWTVVGGAASGDYLIGVRGLEETAPAPSTDVCGAVVHVSATAMPSGTSFLLERSQDGNPSVYLAFSIAAVPTSACPPPAGLECNGLAAPP